MTCRFSSISIQYSVFSVRWPLLRSSKIISSISSADDAWTAPLLSLTTRSTRTICCRPEDFMFEFKV